MNRQFHFVLACAFLLSSCGDTGTHAPALSAKKASSGTQMPAGTGITSGATKERGSFTEDAIGNADQAQTLEEFAAAAGPVTKAKLLTLNENIRKSGSDPKPYIARSEFLRRADKLELALADAQKAVELDPNNILAHRHRAECLELSQREEEALKDHEMILKQLPLDKTALLHRGLFYISRNKNREAVTDFTKLIDAGSTNKAAFTWRAKAHQNLGEYEKAVEDFELHLKHRPNDEKSIQKHLDLCLKLGKWEKAMVDTDKLLVHYPRDSTLHMTKGDIFSGLKQYKQAIDEYTVAAEAEPSFAKAFEKRARAYEKDNRLELAKKDWARVETLRKVRPDREAQSKE